MADLLIADVNNHHPVKNWAQYKAFSPVLIAKMTEGKTFLAPTFAKHREGARKHKLRAFGAYHFWSPGVDPIAQARNAVKALGTLADDPFEWLVLDVETGEEFEAFEAFCQHADAKLGRITWLYGGKQLKGKMPHRPRWVARYFDHTPNPAKQPGIGEVLWQFTDRFEVPGVGPADCNVFRGTAEQFMETLTGGRMATLDKDDLAAIEKVIRTVLNEGTGKGQKNWAGTSKDTLRVAQTNHNDLAQIRASLAEVSDLLGPDGKTLVEAIAARLGQ